MRISRRQLLIASALAAGGAAVAGGGAAAAKFRNVDLFSRYIEATQEILAVQFGDKEAQTLVRESRQVYDKLLPEVPYIGGDENLNSENLLVSAYCLSMYRVLSARGQTTEQVGRFIYEAYEAVTDLPGWLCAVVKRLKYGSKNRERLREQAAASQERRYPGDWVFTFVEGDGQAFDYGLDFSECGICKLYHAQGADELTPYLCLSDYVVGKAFDRGFVRYKTLAEGADVCDFRYKEGRESFVYPLRDGWPPQFAGSYRSKA
jgi:hypothetical protein